MICIFGAKEVSVCLRAFGPLFFFFFFFFIDQVIYRCRCSHWCSTSLCEQFELVESCCSAQSQYSIIDRLACITCILKWTWKLSWNTVLKKWKWPCLMLNCVLYELVKKTRGKCWVESGLGCNAKFHSWKVGVNFHFPRCTFSFCFQPL